jgi:hypothetical protein
MEVDRVRRVVAFLFLASFLETDASSHLIGSEAVIETNIIGHRLRGVFPPTLSVVAHCSRSRHVDTSVISEPS